MKRQAVVKVSFSLCLLLCSTAMLLANEVTDRLLAMNEQARHAELTKKINMTGNRCDAVTRSMHMNDNSNGTASWSIECKDKNSYAMVLGPATQPTMVVAWKCSELKTLFPQLECFKK